MPLGAVVLKLTFLGRVESRWRVRVDLPCGHDVAGITLGLVAEDGRLLGPQMVASGGEESCFIAELGGPCLLPPGTVVRCVADYADGRSEEATVRLDRRSGLHAFLHADARLPVLSRVTGESLTRNERRRFGGSYPWVSVCDTCVDPAAKDDLLSMLKDEFDVDPDDLDDDLRAMLEGVEPRTD